MGLLRLPSGYPLLFSALFAERFAYFGTRSILFYSMTDVLLIPAGSATTVFQVIDYLPVLMIIGGLAVDKNLLPRNATLTWPLGALLLGCVSVGMSCYLGLKSLFWIGTAIIAVGEIVFLPAFYLRLYRQLSTSTKTDITVGFLIVSLAASFGAFAGTLICPLIDGLSRGAGYLAAGSVIPIAIMLLRNLKGSSTNSDRTPPDSVRIAGVLLLVAVLFVLGSSLRRGSIELANGVSDPTVQMIAALTSGLIAILSAVALSIWWSRRFAAGSPVTTSAKLKTGLALGLASTVVFAFIDLGTTSKVDLASALIFVVSSSLVAIGATMVEPVGLAVFSSKIPGDIRATAVGGWLAALAIVPSLTVYVDPGLMVTYGFYAASCTMVGALLLVTFSNKYFTHLNG